MNDHHQVVAHSLNSRQRRIQVIAITTYSQENRATKGASRCRYPFNLLLCVDSHAQTLDSLTASPFVSTNNLITCLHCRLEARGVYVYTII
jgi:hypothetical protein